MWQINTKTEYRFTYASGDIVLESSEVIAIWKQNFRSLFISSCQDEISILCFDQCDFDICLNEMNTISMNEHMPYEVEFAPSLQAYSKTFSSW